MSDEQQSNDDERRDGAGDRRLSPKRRGGRRSTDIPADYVSVTEYARRHSVDRKTVFKWMDAGLLDFYRIMEQGGIKPLIRIRNVPPARSAAENPARHSPS